MENDGADQLNLKSAVAENPVRRFPDGGKRFRQQIVQRGAVSEARLEFGCFRGERLIRKRSVFAFQCQRPVHQRHDLFDFAFTGCPKQFGDNAHSSLFSSPHIT